MIQLYHAGGAGDFTIIQDGLTHDQCRVLFENAARLLAARSQARAAEILRSVPFRVVEAINHFNDEFSILHAVVPLEEYEQLRRSQQDAAEKEAFRQVAEVLSELGTYIRFIAIELALERPVPAAVRHGHGLKQSEIHRLVYKYIGVSAGYLGDFSYRSHHEFYVQLIGSSEFRTEERASEIRSWIRRLRSGPHVEQPDLRITSEVVERALLDAQELLRATGATSGVDRIHTALHGYLREVCKGARIKTTEDASLTDLFKRIRETHPAFREVGPRSDDILRVLRAIATILDSLNPLRNRASVAHPNPALLPEPEAMLVINAARSILHYVDEKVHRHMTRGE